MARHSPGPWSFGPPYFGFSVITGRNGELVFGVAAGSKDEKRSDAECEANARLIVAAPDYYAAAAPLVDLVLPDDDTLRVAVTVGELRALQKAHAKAEQR